MRRSCRRRWLATLVGRLPAASTGGRAGLRYEPKWDGFRCVARKDDDGAVELTSRRQRRMNTAFPDIVAAAFEHLPTRTVVDGELVCWVDGRLDFSALQRRNAAGRRAESLATTEPCHYIVFDILEREGRDLRDRPLSARREQLEELFQTVPRTSPLTLGMHTTDRATAEHWFEQLAAVGVEGLVVKNASERYRAGTRGWRKVKHYATTEAIIGGVTGHLDRPAELILGRYASDTGEFRVIARTVPLKDHEAADIAAAITPAGDDHPWPDQLPAFWLGASKEPTEYHRVVPEAVAEIRVDPATQAGRWRHGSRYLRLRPDVDAGQVPHDLDVEAS